MLNTKSQYKISVDFSKKESADIFRGNRAEMRKQIRILAVILVFSLPIWIDEICKFHPDSVYCRTIGPFICDPEPISMGNNGIISFSASATVQVSEVTTTVLPYGTISGSTTTT